MTGISAKSNLRYGKRGKGTSAFKEVNITARAEKTITFAIITLFRKGMLSPLSWKGINE